jgi:hypothetical protein
MKSKIDRWTKCRSESLLKVFQRQRACLILYRVAPASQRCGVAETLPICQASRHEAACGKMDCERPVSTTVDGGFLFLLMHCNSIRPKLHAQWSPGRSAVSSTEVAGGILPEIWKELLESSNVGAGRKHGGHERFYKTKDASFSSLQDRSIQ